MDPAPGKSIDVSLLPSPSSVNGPFFILLRPKETLQTLQSRCSDRKEICDPYRLAVTALDSVPERCRNQFLRLVEDEEYFCSLQHGFCLVFPRISKNFNADTQQQLQHMSLHLMPLRPPKCASPRFTAHFFKIEACSILNTMNQGDSVVIKPLASLLAVWFHSGSGKNLQNKFKKRCSYLPEKITCQHTCAVPRPGGASSVTSVLDEPKPADIIFFILKALMKDLDCLISSSAILAGNVGLLTEFSRQFNLLQLRYHFHTAIEDKTAFPSLKGNGEVQNISLFSSIDHNLEAEYFNRISRILEKLSDIVLSSVNLSFQDHNLMKYNKLCVELHQICMSMHKILADHIHYKLIEVLPLIRKKSIKEQEDIIGNHLGEATMEIIQDLIPWLLSSLTLEELDIVMSLLHQVTKNTMFDEWLDEWLEGNDTDHESEESTALTTELLEIMLKYLPEDSPGQTFQLTTESAIRKAYCDPSFDPENNSYIMHYLQLRISKVTFSSDGEKIPGQLLSYSDSQNSILGCKHYKRKCKLVMPCCNRIYTCIRCHDEESDHSANRRAITQMMCMKCLVIQPIRKTCVTYTCNNLSMGAYYCRICKLFDDEREIYHCPYCNLCRLGKGLGIKYFHCMTCNACLTLSLRVHKCREKFLEANCPRCHNNMFTSYTKIRVFRCGHLMHSECFEEYLKYNYVFPICSKSVGDLQDHFKMLDAMLAATKMPDEYIGKTHDIQCNDCDKKGVAAFHWRYHKCSYCGSYNTRVLSNILRTSKKAFLIPVVLLVYQFDPCAIHVTLCYSTCCLLW